METDENTKWCELKEIIRGENAVENLKGYDRYFLKNFHMKSGFNLLHLAIDNDNSDVIKYLLDIGCNLYQKTVADGRTPLNYFLENCRVERSLLEHFIEKGANLSWTYIGDKFGTVKIDDCLAYYFYYILLDKSPYKTIDDKHNQSLTDDRTESETLYKFLSDLGWPIDGIASLCDENLTMYTLEKLGLKASYCHLIEAAKQGDVHQVNSLLKKNMLTPHKIILCNALLEASRFQSPSSEIIIKLLLDRGAYIDGFNKKFECYDYPLCEAYRLHNLNNAWFLLDNGADVIYLRWTDQIVSYKADEQQQRDFFYSNSKCLASLLQHEVFCNKFKLDFFPRFIAIGCYLEKNDDTDVPYRSYYTQPVIKWLAKLHNLDQVYWSKSILKSEFLSEYFSELIYSEELDPHYEEKFEKYFDDYFDGCDKEIIKMKSFMISEKITAWYILSKSVEKIIPYMRNDKLIRESKVLSLDKIFPLYSDILQFKMTKAHERALQIDKSMRVLSTCLPQLGSNYLILEMIVKYLGVPNLLIFY